MNAICLLCVWLRGSLKSKETSGVHSCILQPGAPWAEWLSLRAELIDEFGDVLSVAPVGDTYARRREQSAALRKAVRELVAWGIIKDPFIDTPASVSLSADSDSSDSSDDSSDDDGDGGEPEPLAPASADHEHPGHDLKCPDCG
eukprot:SAG22_NODE_4649_length_1205_cov_0.783906_2_plen_144_part_00